MEKRTQSTIALLSASLLLSYGASSGAETNDSAARADSVAAAQVREQVASVAKPNYLRIVGPANCCGSNVDTSLFILDGAAKGKLQRTVKVTLNQSSGTPSITTTAISKSGGITQILGDAVLIYVYHGRLMKISLKSTDSRTPRQVTSMSDVCAIVRKTNVSLDGTESVVTVRRAAKNGTCDYGNPLAYAKLSQPSSAAPIAFPKGTVVDNVIVDPLAGKLLGYLATVNASKLAFITADLSKSFLVQGASNVIDPTPASSSLYAGRDLYLTKKAVYRLSLSDSSASFRKLHALSSNSSLIISDASTSYLSDGQELYSITTDSQKTLLTTLSSTPKSFGMTKTHLLYVDSAEAVWSVAKAGGTTKLLIQPTTDYYSRILGFKGSSAYILQEDKSYITRVVNLVPLDGSKPSKRIVQGSALSDVMAVSNSESVNGIRDIDGLIYLLGGKSSPTYEARNRLVHYNLKSGRKTELGQFDSGAKFFSIDSTRQYGDRPFFLRAIGAHGTRYFMDAYFAKPDSAGSLMNVTKILR